jgi:alpha-glucosidase
MTDGPLGSIHHDGSPRYVIPLGHADPDHLRIGDEVRLRVRAGLDVPIDRIFVRTTPDGEQAFDELRETVAGPAAAWWETTIRLSMPTNTYRFLLLVPGGRWWLTGAGLRLATPTDANDFRILTGYESPPWLRDTVFYQIFPDRFANGDPTNDVATGAWTYRGQPAQWREWGDPPTPGRSALVEFYGGDLAGIVQHLDHIADLGANALYLTPIFETRSNHGYDIVDYDHVAAHFGGDEALLALRAATREREIRLMLDIAPNHVGVAHPWFQQALADRDAASSEFFTFRRHPDDYESWLGHDTLPKLNYRSMALREAMYAGQDAVMRRWLRAPFSIDGWRVDVGNMLGRLGPDQLGPEVTRGIRSAVKSESPTAYLLGEHSYDATSQLAGDQWDGAMNYAGFMMPVIEWLAGFDFWSPGRDRIRGDPSSTATMIETLDGFRAAIPWVIARQQYNLVGSHDTGRIRSVLGGDAGRLRAALGLLLSYVGVPSIFYGDEVGLQGASDIAARRTMPWDGSAWDHGTLTFLRTLIRARRASAALRAGGFQVLDVANDSLAFLRDTDDEFAVVVINRGPTDRPAAALPAARGAIPDRTEFVEISSRERATVTGGALPIPATPPGAAIWIGRSPS